MRFVNTLRATGLLFLCLLAANIFAQQDSTALEKPFRFSFGFTGGLAFPGKDFVKGKNPSIPTEFARESGIRVGAYGAWYVSKTIGIQAEVSVFSFQFDENAFAERLTSESGPGYLLSERGLFPTFDPVSLLVGPTYKVVAGNWLFTPHLLLGSFHLPATEINYLLKIQNSHQIIEGSISTEDTWGFTWQPGIEVGYALIKKQKLMGLLTTRLSYAQSSFTTTFNKNERTFISEEVTQQAYQQDQMFQSWMLTFGYSFHIDGMLPSAFRK